MTCRYSIRAEWLEADGLGGFATGTIAGFRTRRYHSVLTVAAEPPTSRFLLVNGFDAHVETSAGEFALSTQRYVPDTTDPAGFKRIDEFHPEPWPRWVFRLEDGTGIEFDLFMRHGMPLTAMRWRLLDRESRRPAILSIRPFFTGRDSHKLHLANNECRRDAERAFGRLRWSPYDGVPPLLGFTTGTYSHDPEWYRNFQYDAERARGYEFQEDCWSPGILKFDLQRHDGILILAAENKYTADIPPAVVVEGFYEELAAAERERRRRFPSALERAADAFVVERAGGRTILAGYPWFADWGRWTFLSLRGICLATGHLLTARDVLVTWARQVSDGLIPNRFPDWPGPIEYHSVDASLWFALAGLEWLEAWQADGRSIDDAEPREIRWTIDSIASRFEAGTRHGIRLDADGLLASGEPGFQVTWMDVRTGDKAPSARVGKPVEVQALWLNVLDKLARLDARWVAPRDKGLETFRLRFWNEEKGYLYDVIDADHEWGRNDSKLRPNQILAVGGLPLSLLDTERSRRVVEAVERALWVPMGLRTLAPDEPGYRGQYRGNVAERDDAYHNGTAWPWLLGPFVQAWLAVNGDTEENRRVARERFLDPLLKSLPEHGLNHLSEIADGNDPHKSRGVPFHAAAAGEAIRLAKLLGHPLPG